MNARQREIVEELRRRYAELAGEPRPEGDAPAGWRSLGEALSEDALALVVEPKRATARRGTINPALDVAAVVRECQAGGAAAISVVTEPQLSGGSLADLVAARGACELPLLARDFVVDVRQVHELRSAGADALFIPVMVFDDVDDLRPGQRLDDIVDSAMALGMEVVLSVCNEDELELALAADPDVLNIDNRADDGRIDVERTFELLAAVPAGKAVISESVARGEEVARLHRAGVDGLLLDEGHLDTGLTNALAVFHDLTLD
jgi:indole-3-glycerol phosphate synthase